MIGKWVVVGSLIMTILLFGGLVDARASGDDIQDVVVLDNESVQVVLLTFPPGSVAEQHVNPEPELGIILEGDRSVPPSGGFLSSLLSPGCGTWHSAVLHGQRTRPLGRGGWRRPSRVGRRVATQHGIPEGGGREMSCGKRCGV